MRNENGSALIGPTKGNIVYLCLAPGGSVQYVGSTGDIKRRKGDTYHVMQPAPTREGFVTVTVGPFATRAEAYEIENRLLGLLKPPLNAAHFVPSRLYS
jgi:hypothetical protein